MLAPITLVPFQAHEAVALYNNNYRLVIATSYRRSFNNMIVTMQNDCSKFSISHYIFCSVKKWMEGIVNQSEMRYWSKIEPLLVNIVEEINNIYKEEFLEYAILDSDQEDNENQEHMKKENLKCREDMPSEKSLLNLK